MVLLVQTALACSSTLPHLPTQVEPLVAPHMVSLLERSLRLVVSERDPYGHLQLMRSMFKAVAGAGPKLKLIYADLLPLVQPVLGTVSEMLAGPNAKDLQTLLLELCLNLPAQLNNLISLMPKLMKLVLQVRANTPVAL